MAATRSETNRRLMAWGAGTAVILAGFFLRRVLQRAGGPAGTAVRLFSIGTEQVRLYESPGGGDWLVSVPVKGPATTGLRPFLAGLAWASWSPRVVRPFSQPGSYLLSRSRLRRLWAVQADGWLDAQHLFAVQDAGVQLGKPASLDLRTRRTRFLTTDFESDSPYLHDDVPRSSPSLHPISTNGMPDSPDVIADLEGDTLENTPDIPDLAIPGTDGWSGEREHSWKWGQVRDQRVLLATVGRGEEGRPGLYGLSNDEAPHSLYLTVEGVPVALSRDGRTVFFEREHALWRLDLRKPLPQLLDDVKVPALPDPPEMN